MCSNPLCLKVFAHIVIPHVPCVHCIFIANRSSLDSNVLPVCILLNLLPLYSASLSTESQFEIMAIVEAVSQVLLNLLFDRVDHSDLLLAQIPINWDELDLAEFEDNGRVLTGASW